MAAGEAIQMRNEDKKERTFSVHNIVVIYWWY
jgi:hypothetical protein